MSQTTTINYTCDVCRKEGVGSAQWDQETIKICKVPQNRLMVISQGPYPTLDVCGECWQAILTTMDKQRNIAYLQRKAKP
jgi:hypothetical protein